MRNGFRSSRGAILGTIGGAAGFTTVAIGVGPFSARGLLASIQNYEIVFASFPCCLGPDRRIQSRFTRLPLAAPYCSHTSIDTVLNRNARLRRWPQAAGPAPLPCAC